MRNCSETKRKNNDEKILANLESVFAYYQQLGHRSNRPCAQLQTLNNIHATINRRKRHGQSVPESWHTTIQQIYALPTQKQWETKNALDIRASIAATRESNYKKLAKIIPNIRIIKTLFGDAEFNTLLDTPIDSASAFLFNTILEDMLASMMPERAATILKLYSGCPVRDADIVAYAKTHNISPSGWTMREIGMYYGLTHGRVGIIIGKQSRRMAQQLTKYYKSYINNDIETILTDFKNIPNLRPRFEFYRRYKINDIDVSEMNRAGQWLLNNFVKQK
ncbi:MAG: hypothetical protein IKA73_00615 [Alphaproteobacteria bacterium]|nr:hypothetical protein [Alphaproteobacteria bacterium]